MNDKLKRFLARVATTFTFTFIVSWVIVTLLPSCFWLSLGIYLACSSGSWLAIMVALITVSITIGLIVATISHWNDHR